MKIPMVSYPIMTTLVPPESSIIGVSGAVRLWRIEPTGERLFKNFLVLNHSFNKLSPYSTLQPLFAF